MVVIPVLILVWGTNASRPGSQVEGCFDGCAISVPDPNPALRVISLNILHGFPTFHRLNQRLELIAQELIRLEPDIILLQEVPWTPKTGNAAGFLAGRVGMNYAYLGANGNKWTLLFEEGEAILSRYPLWDLEYIELQPRAGFFEHRVVLHATATTTLGDIDLFVTHLTNGEAEVNQAQSAALQAFVNPPRSHFAIIAGDFNAEPDSQQIQVLQSRWVDAFTLTDLAAGGNTCCIADLTKDSGTPNKRIDYIFLAPGMALPAVVGAERVFTQAYRIHDQWLWVSDHIGVMVDLGPAP